MIEKEAFGPYEKYVISDGALSVAVSDLGATLLSVKLNGEEMLLGYGSPEQYLAGTSYVGAGVGRYANRIAASRFQLNGREYALPANEGRNQLHGGPDAFDRRVWQAQITGESAVCFSLFSPAGDNGYPANLTARFVYSVAGNALRIDFLGESDGDTVYAPTSHAYFCLGGYGRALDTEMRIDADTYIKVDEELLPVGDPAPVEGSEFDFRSSRVLGREYDQFFCLNKGGSLIARNGGYRLTIDTDMPGIQIYTGQGLAAPLCPYAGVAIEPAFPPDSPNRPDFPSPLLKAGEKFSRYACYTFEKE